MKTLSVLLFGVILIFAGCSKTDDFPEGNMTDNQLKSADNRSFKMFFIGGYTLPVICDGVTVDYLEVEDGDESIITRVTAHITDGKFAWAIVHANASLTSQLTGETFKINETDKITFDQNEEVTSIMSRAHAQGDQGTHVIMFFEIDFATWTFELIKGNCPGNNE